MSIKKKTAARLVRKKPRKSTAPTGKSGIADVAAYYREVVGRAGGPNKERGELFVKDGGDLTIADANAADVIAEGLPAKIVGTLGESIAVDKAMLLKTIGIDKATLARRQAGEKDLDPAQAEGVLRTIELTTIATGVFGTLEKAVAWLTKPHPVLEGEAPLSYATNQYAFARVKSILSAIRYGGVV